MTDTVEWTTSCASNNVEKAHLLLKRLQRALDVGLVVGEVERYWKDESLYRCTFTTPLPSKTRKDRRSLY